LWLAAQILPGRDRRRPASNEMKRGQRPTWLQQVDWRTKAARHSGRGGGCGGGAGGCGGGAHEDAVVGDEPAGQEDAAAAR
jgi:hypothetical protein